MIKIRKITPLEASLVLDLIEEFDRPVAPRPDEEQVKQIVAQIEQAGGSILGAFDDDRMVGTCSLNLCANLSWSGRPYAMIENVIVTSDYRNRGIGKALLRQAREIAEQRGCYKVALMTGSKREATLKFYQEAGFSGDKTGFQHRFNG